MPFRFIHTADIHLDSPLRSLALRDAELSALVGNATRQAFARIIELCLEEAVDALLISGDLYDGDQTSMKTARFLAQQLRRLNEAGIRTYVIRGNHDALSKITSELVLPESVTVFGGRAEAIELDRPRGGIPVVIHGLSFSKPQAPETLLPRYKPPVEGAVNIGLMHTSLGGVPGHDPYAPCSIADLQASGFRYWALGHIHARSVVNGSCTVVMPGIPQGRDINESGPKSCSLVTIGDDGSIAVEERLTSIARFERLSLDVSPFTEWRDLALAITDRLEAAQERTGADHLVARLMLEGATPLAWRLRRDSDLLKAEADERASIIGRTWIEAVDARCHGLETRTDSGPDPLNELKRLIDGEVLGSVAFTEASVAAAEELRSNLPVDLRRMLGGDEESFAAVLSELSREGVEDVLARLQAANSGGQA